MTAPTWKQAWDRRRRERHGKLAYFLWELQAVEQGNAVSPAQPGISLLLLACNQQSTARAAALSCSLAQDCEPLEIVLSDDASTDATFAELQAAAADYRGPHRVRTRRNEVNLGIGAHYNRLIAETRGALLVTAAGDDISLPQRVQRWPRPGTRAAAAST